jgi:hypothetical protein
MGLVGRRRGRGARWQVEAYLHDVALEIDERAVKRKKTNHFVSVVVVVADVAEGRHDDDETIRKRST